MEKDEIRETIQNISISYSIIYTLEQIKEYFEQTFKVKKYKDVTLTIAGCKDYDEAIEINLTLEGTRKKTQEEIKSELENIIKIKKNLFLNEYHFDSGCSLPKGLSDEVFLEIKRLERIERYKQLKPSYESIKNLLTKEELKEFIYKNCKFTIQEIEYLIYGEVT